MIDIRKFRISKKMTQDQVSREIGISRAFYTRVENGVCRPSVDVAKRIAILLGFDWTEFYDQPGKNIAIVTQPANGEEQVVGIAEVTKKYDVTTVDDATETNPTLKVGIHSERHIQHEPARAPAEAVAPTGRYAEIVALRDSYDGLVAECKEAQAAGADDHTLQCLANEIGATGQDLDELESVEEEPGA